MRRNHVAVEAFAFLGEPFDERSRVDDLAARLGERFALLCRHQPGEILLIGKQQFVPAAQDLRPLAGGPGTPPGLRQTRRLDGAPGLGRAGVGYGRQLLAGGRIGHGKGPRTIGADPLPIDVAPLPEQ
ncbi:MAG: hypothetical protein AW08_00319 [Candidatus Accumulibacter adjunctus]|uniref:Uncharacterized protein n=1 Tax=Candidatus Accumulibacter adjunctus TaxID=1454001 RepID=A0A011N4J3_9PROT|nr:MAG: hypothetical protein AW08_00319 [Candidatus Accumulibacter adjunctus]